MTAMFQAFSVRNLLVLSLALNLGFFLREVYDCGNLGFNGVSPADYQQPVGSLDNNRLINLDQYKFNAGSKLEHLFPVPMLCEMGFPVAVGLGGDPTMYEKYWQQVGDKATIVIPGWQSMSYFSDVKNPCWFLEPEFSKQIVRLHKIVGNAVTHGRQIVVGTGSTQLYQAVLYALAPQDAEEPIPVVSAAPFYSSYPAITDCVKSGIYKWGGDACSFAKEGNFIELVTSPNNPDGFSRDFVVNRTGGILVHDLAYYWPQYTPISSPADHDIMLFTVSKSTGHAGMRMGWALVKDQEIAKKMIKYIELSSIGVSKDSQLRAAKVMNVISDTCESSQKDTLFEFAYQNMEKRWELLREAVKTSGQFSLPDFPPGFCQYHKRVFKPQPAFAWLKCEEPIKDCEEFLRANKILTRSGIHFGSGPEYVRISMLERDHNYKLFIDRLSNLRVDKSRTDVV